ncbi:DUF983 domain-containing protein [Polaribacter sp. Z014]|uniref:DUF983 domain-containing protein n=1 Tax=unclassified Polaribacter TaxID=196858 RepID=UPI00193B13C2|nr:MULTISPECIES: DUF983 domain-containing protein [unclassified Polaribacter]MCL7765113.1 DUF983 domain-containing protein [Polaribacter sp. Z014]QVY64973.1 DUF983 domain-containing protein [Polaribacter sp. Q13]
MFKKGTKLYSIFNAKCPRCHEGEFFKYKFTFNPNKVTKLHNNCPKCNLKYMMEPSFFYGAMYVNYGLTVALSVAVFVISSLFFGLNLLQCFAAIVIALLVLAPFNLRLSRIIWINMFVHFDKKAIKKES